MSIDYDSQRIYEANSSSSVKEHRFWKENFDNGTGIKILFNYSAQVSQIIATWETSTDMVLSVQLPSGVAYTIAEYSAVTSFVVNHQGSGANSFVYWTKLPRGSFLRLGVDSADSAPGDLDVSVIANPV